MEKHRLRLRGYTDNHKLPERVMVPGPVLTLIALERLLAGVLAHVQTKVSLPGRLQINIQI